MVETLDQDLYALKEWLRGAWSSLADPALAPFERRELRNYMREAHLALRAGLRRQADREQALRATAKRRAPGLQRLDFRLIRLDA